MSRKWNGRIDDSSPRRSKIARALTVNCHVVLFAGAFSVLCIHTVVFAFVLSSSAFDTSSWQRFWWWTPGQTWPVDETDVLKNAYGTCTASSGFPLGLKKILLNYLPSTLKELSISGSFTQRTQLPMPCGKLFTITWKRLLEKS